MSRASVPNVRSRRIRGGVGEQLARQELCGFAQRAAGLLRQLGVPVRRCDLERIPSGRRALFGQ